jgi:hypothetical protein
MHQLPDAEQEVKFHLCLFLVQRVRERDLEQLAALDALARALTPAQEIEQVVYELLIAEPQADSHGRW